MFLLASLNYQLRVKVGKQTEKLMVVFLNYFQVIVSPIHAAL